MEFTEPLSDCRMLANRIGSEKRNRPAGIDPSVSERCTSAPQPVCELQGPGAEQRPAQPPVWPGAGEPYQSGEQQRRTQGEGIAAAAVAAGLEAQRRELCGRCGRLGRGCSQ